MKSPINEFSPWKRHKPTEQVSAGKRKARIASDCVDPGTDAGKPDYIDYHDHEWGVPVHDDHQLFEFLTLEAAQAGLSWYTVLRKRENYRIAFDRFDPEKVAGYNDQKVQALLENSGIIRNPESEKDSSRRSTTPEIFAPDTAEKNSSLFYPILHR